MFLISNKEMLLAAAEAGILGAMPSLNQRTTEAFVRIRMAQGPDGPPLRHQSHHRTDRPRAASARRRGLSRSQGAGAHHELREPDPHRGRRKEGGNDRHARCHPPQARPEGRGRRRGCHHRRLHGTPGGCIPTPSCRGRNHLSVPVVAAGAISTGENSPLRSRSAGLAYMEHASASTSAERPSATRSRPRGDA